MKAIHYLKKIRSHLVTNAALASFTPKSNLKLRFTLHFRYSIVIPRFISCANTAQSVLDHCGPWTTGFKTILTTTTLLIVTNYCAQLLLVLTLYVNEYL